jgi:hypothetical protein
LDSLTLAQGNTSVDEDGDAQVSTEDWTATATEVNCERNAMIQAPYSGLAAGAVSLHRLFVFRHDHHALERVGHAPWRSCRAAC